MSGWTTTPRKLLRAIQTPSKSLLYIQDVILQTVNSGQHRRNNVQQHNIRNAINFNLLYCHLSLYRRKPLYKEALPLKVAEQLEATASKPLQESTNNGYRREYTWRMSSTIHEIN
uniref:Uncharacterized protein n=1 Tax=Homalodisca liturata TaxID=320908 RepID=A0A1B6J546_9HEMI